MRIASASVNMASSIVDIENFLDMYARLRERVLYFTVDKLIDRPISFTKNELDFDMANEYPFAIKRLLKNASEFNKDTIEADGGAESSAEGENIGDIQQTYSNMKDTAEEVDIASGPFKAALQKLNDCLQPENLDAILKIQQRQRMENDEIKEEDILVGIGIHIIAKLSGKAVASREKSLHKCPCGCNKNLQVGDKMYIGSEDTWHGELDMFGLGDNNQVCVGVTVAKDVSSGDVKDSDADSQGECDGDSQGEHTDLESCKEPVISRSIVFGWTLFNRHKNLSPFIPSVFIDAEKFLFFIYNPVQDILLSSEDYIRFFNEKCPCDLPKDRFAGFFLLWVVLNHQLFFRQQLRGIDSPVASGFRNKILNLEPYEKLEDFRVSVQRRPTNFNNWCTGHRDVLKRKLSELDD